MGDSILKMLSDGPERLFLIDREQKLSRKNCAEIVAERVQILNSNGLPPGGIVAAAFEPSVNAVIWILSLIEAGFFVLPVNLREPQQVTRKHLDRLGVVLLLDEKTLLEPGNSDERSPTKKGSLLIGTSGTTADRKLVQLDFPSLIHGAACAIRHLDFGPGDHWYLNLPLYHVGGLGPIWRALVGGGALVLPESGEDFSHVSMVPTQLRRAIQNQQLASFKKCKTILMGGAPIPESLLQDAHDEGLAVVTSYGMTETGSLIAINGQSTESCEIEVAADGEIMVRGPGLFSGYFQSGEGDLFFPQTSEGWFQTGDLGLLDESGNLEVIGRKDNLFISGGENIQPEEIESALLSLASIHQAIVVGVPDAEFGARPVAFVDGDMEHLGAQLGNMLPGFKIPEKFFPLPKNTNRGLKHSRKELLGLAISALDLS